jgi:hypothetical protein
MLSAKIDYVRGRAPDMGKGLFKALSPKADISGQPGMNAYLDTRSYLRI